jgi:predicted metal-dependent hydrolase
MSDTLFFQAVQEFNRGHFFEAHELWEELWNETVDEEKRFYQALVQIAAGYHKLSLAQYNGARKLLERGWQTIGAFPTHYIGIDLAPLLTALESTLSNLAKNQTTHSFPAPKLRVLPAVS